MFSHTADSVADLGGSGELYQPKFLGESGDRPQDCINHKKDEAGHLACGPNTPAHPHVHAVLSSLLTRGLGCKWAARLGCGPESIALKEVNRLTS